MLSLFRQASTLVPLSGQTNVVWSVAISPDGRSLASGSADTSITVWHLPDGQQVRTLTGHTDVVWCVAINRDGQTLVRGTLSLECAREERRKVSEVTVKLTDY
jgi:WD40 repeat protein